MTEDPQKGRLEQLLSELGRKADHWLDNAKDATEDTRKEVNDHLKDLQQAKEKLEEELNAYAKDEERWKGVKHRLHNAADELKNALELIFAKSKQQDQTPPSSDPNA